MQALAEVAEWHTRRFQKPVPAREWGFESPLRHSGFAGFLVPSNPVLVITNSSSLGRIGYSPRTGLAHDLALRRNPKPAGRRLRDVSGCGLAAGRTRD